MAEEEEEAVIQILDKSRESTNSEKSDVSDLSETVQQIVLLDQRESTEITEVTDGAKTADKASKRDKKVMISAPKKKLECVPIPPPEQTCPCECESIIPVIDPEKQRPLLEARADLKVELKSLSEEELYADLGRPYNFFKEIGTVIVRNDLINRIKFATKIMIHNPDVIHAENPNSLFSWGPEEYAKRRQDNAVWLELLELNVPPAFLNTLKFRIDMEEAVRYFVFVTNYNDTNYEEGLDFIKAAQTLLNIDETLDEEVTKYSSEAKQLDDYYLAQSIFQEDQETEQLKRFLYFKLFNFEAVNPIELRVEILDIRAQAELAEYELYKLERDTRRDIEKWRTDRHNRTMSHSNIMDAYYLQSEECKKYLYIMSNKYDVEFDELDFSIAEYKLKIQKMQDTKKNREARMKEMKRELDAFRREQYMRRQRAIRRLQAIEEGKAMKARLEAEKKARRKGKKNK